MRGPLSSLLPRSIRARFTIAAAALALVALTVIGAGVDYSIRNMIEDHIYKETGRVATDWIASMRPDRIPPPITTPRIDLLQLVDSRQHVVAASAAAAGRPPLSTLLPPTDDRIQSGTRCSPGTGCLMLTAVRIFPQEVGLLWGGETHVVYAAMRQPPVLATRELELVTAGLVLVGVGLVALTTWLLVGRTLRPVAAIRSRIAEITVSDLSLRVPEPRSDDEIGQLARTANRTLAQLEESVAYQRHFASMVSHELKNPVAGLQTQLEEALLYPGQVDRDETIRSALSTATRLRAIIDDMLVFARVRNVSPEGPAPVDLTRLVRDEVVARATGVPVRADAEPGVRVLGNHIQLAAVVSNLMVNAQRHAATSVEVTVRRSGGHAVVAVTDDGDGIALRDRERVFEPFVRLQDGRRRDPKGSGLGLAISRAIALAHDGTLTIEDSPRGARFVLRLPLFDAGPPPRAEGAPEGLEGRDGDSGRRGPAREAVRTT
ncbi:sensor histidine kinase [Microbispora corallina]|uniref:sensor histidine kinase n=1 Tax=Microbispora corallina TaxID=83302 RepID=UPI00194F3DA6|nr:HAMP domain-containing sensor histidine kinase [Microbispora corallina]